MQPTGSASFTVALPIGNCQTSISVFAPIAVYLLESITLPPPTAKIKSTFSFFATSTAFLTKVSLGLGSTPPIST